MIIKMTKMMTLRGRAQYPTPGQLLVILMRPSLSCSTLPSCLTQVAMTYNDPAIQIKQII